MNKLIIFDCDGTLVDSEVIATEFFTSYWSKFGVDFTYDEFKEKFIGTGSNHPIVIETFSKMPSYVEKEGDELFKKELLEKLCPVAGIKNLLENLNCEICVASNSKLDYVKQALNKTDLKQYFGDKVFSAEQVNNPKPAPDLFLYVCHTLNYHPQDCIVIEDSVSGIKAAQNAGIKVVGFSGAGHFTHSLEQKLKYTNPDWFFRSTKELGHFLLSL